MVPPIITQPTRPADEEVIDIPIRSERQKCCSPVREWFSNCLEILAECYDLCLSDCRKCCSCCKKCRKNKRTYYTDDDDDDASWTNDDGVTYNASIVQNGLDGEYQNNDGGYDLEQVPCGGPGGNYSELPPGTHAPRNDDDTDQQRRDSENKDENSEKQGGMSALGSMFANIWNRDSNDDHKSGDVQRHQSDDDHDSGYRGVQKDSEHHSSNDAKHSGGYDSGHHGSSGHYSIQDSEHHSVQDSGHQSVQDSGHHGGYDSGHHDTGGYADSGGYDCGGGDTGGDCGGGGDD